MTGVLQPLEQSQSLVDPATGFPTMYFIRWAQQRQIDISEGITADQAQAIVVAYLASKPLVEGTGINLTPSGNIAAGVTISAEIQDLLDQISTAHGSVLFRGAADWQALAPGTAGDFLQTAGPGADPLWAPGGGGGGGGGSTLIGTDTAAGGSNVLSVSAIPGTFDHLEVIVSGRSSAGVSSDIVKVTLNADTGANYSYHRWNEFGTSDSGAANEMQLAQIMGSGGPANHRDSAEFSVYNYADFAAARAAIGLMSTTDSGNRIPQFVNAWWNNTANAVTSIELTLTSGNWDAGSTVWVYGVGGSGGGGGGGYERTRVKPVAADFTLQNPGTATMTDGTQGIVINAPNPGGNNIRFAASNTAPPATPYSVIMRSQPVFYNAGLNRYGNSLILRNSATGAIIITGDYDQGFLVQGWSDYFNFATGLYGPAGQDNAPPWQRVTNDGTNLIFGMSSDGQDWYDYLTTPIASFIGAVDEVGFGCFVSGNTVVDIFQSFEVL